MKKFSLPIFILSTMVLVSSCSDSDSNTNIEQQQGGSDSGEYILHDALKANGEVTFKLKSGENVSWKLDNTELKGAEAKFTVKAGKNIVTALFDNGTTITSEVFVPANVKYSIDLSENHALISNGAKGSLYVYGKNDKGQLCLPKATTNIEYPEVILSDKNVTSVATGDSHTLYADGAEVFGCGDNSKGQLGIGNTNEVNEATKVVNLKAIVDKNPSDTPLDNVMVAAGGDVSAAIVVTKKTQTKTTYTGDTYFWGVDVTGGNKNISTPQYSTKTGDTQWATDSEPTITAGSNFVVTKPFGYNFFSYGKNDSWQLGRIDTIEAVSGTYNENHIIKQNPDYSGNIDTNKFSAVMNNMYTPYGVLKEATGASTPNYFSSNPKSIAAAGGNFSLIISKEVPYGEEASNIPTIVYLVGGKASTLGLERSDKKDVVTRVYPIMTSGNKIDTQDKLKKPGSGLDAELENDPLFIGVKVYSKGDDLQITGVTATHVAAGSKNGYILDSNGVLYAFGPNDKNQLASSTKANAKNAKIVTIDAPTGVQKYTDIWAGGNRAIALGSDDKLYTWGDDIATPTKMFFKAANQKITVN